MTSGNFYFFIFAYFGKNFLLKIFQHASHNPTERFWSVPFHFFYPLLRCEQEKYRIMVENGQLERDKLQREANWMDIQLQLAQTELALKKQECQEKGIIIQ